MDCWFSSVAVVILFAWVVGKSELKSWPSFSQHELLTHLFFSWAITSVHPEPLGISALDLPLCDLAGKCGKERDQLVGTKRGMVHRPSNRAEGGLVPGMMAGARGTGEL